MSSSSKNCNFLSVRIIQFFANWLLHIVLFASRLTREIFSTLLFYQTSKQTSRSLLNINNTKNCSTYPHHHVKFLTSHLAIVCSSFSFIPSSLSKCSVWYTCREIEISLLTIHTLYSHHSAETDCLSRLVDRLSSLSIKERDAASTTYMWAFFIQLKLFFSKALCWVFFSFPFVCFNIMECLQMFQNI